MSQGRHRWLVASALSPAAAIVLAACRSATSSAATSPASSIYSWGVVGNQGKIAKLELHKPATVAGVAGNVAQIATSNSDGDALTSAGQVYGWGDNANGQLGTGSSHPTEVFPTDVEIHLTQVSATAQNVAGFDARSR
ncbi:MAG: hypothetical protein ACREOS_12945 [Candidatus Dormibacteraceae bacterium]